MYRVACRLTDTKNSRDFVRYIAPDTAVISHEGIGKNWSRDKSNTAAFFKRIPEVVDYLLEIRFPNSANQTSSISFLPPSRYGRGFA